MAKKNSSSTGIVLTAVALGGLLWLLLRQRQHQPSLPPAGQPRDGKVQPQGIQDEELPRDISIPPFPRGKDNPPQGGGTQPVRAGKISIGDDRRLRPRPADPGIPPAEILPVPVKPIDRLIEARDSFEVEK